MASTQDLRDFFASSGNNPPVTNGQLAKLSAWLTEHMGLSAPATADDFVDYVYNSAREQVVAHQRRMSNVTF